MSDTCGSACSDLERDDQAAFQQTRHLRPDVAIVLRYRTSMVRSSIHAEAERPAIGSTIETPASVLPAHELAEEVVFFSTDTNDVTQYIMAADRLNPNVAGLSRPENPALFQAITMTRAAAMARGIPISVCGEAGSNPPIITKLLSFGIRSLSMSPSSILRIKQFVREEAGL